MLGAHCGETELASEGERKGALVDDATAAARGCKQASGLTNGETAAAYDCIALVMLAIYAEFVTVLLRNT